MGVHINMGILQRQNSIWAGFSGTVSLIPACGISSLWDDQYFFLFPHASVFPLCAVGNDKYALNHEASEVPELFAVRKTSLLAPAVAE